MRPSHVRAAVPPMVAPRPMPRRNPDDEPLEVGVFQADPDAPAPIRPPAPVRRSPAEEIAAIERMRAAEEARTERAMQGAMEAALRAGPAEPASTAAPRAARTVRTRPAESAGTRVLGLGPGAAPAPPRPAPPLTPYAPAERLAPDPGTRWTDEPRGTTAMVTAEELAARRRPAAPITPPRPPTRPTLPPVPTPSGRRPPPRASKPAASPEGAAMRAFLQTELSGNNPEQGKEAAHTLYTLLQQYRWNQVALAQWIGVSQRTMVRWVQQLGLRDRVREVRPDCRGRGKLDT